ncbi:ATP-binding protein [Nocardia callitridis]|uniref:DUF87 domain-containing protein n=1 Tax=Nocardia callitridis TaxID=648753 RepID=A0ABP9KKL5_9NOCA
MSRIDEEQHYALTSIQFSSALAANQIWSPLGYHVDGLHPRATEAITRAVRGATNRPESTPVGLVLSGEHGVGKTHMLGWLRQHVEEAGGAFFMPKLIDGESFWAGAVHGIVNRLLGQDGGPLGRMLGKLAELTGSGPESRMRLRGTIEVSRHDLDEFLDRIQDLDVQVGMQCQDTLRALVLFQSKKFRETGHSFLMLDDGIDAESAQKWGFRDRDRAPQLVFNDLTRLFALVGPVVLAVDQIDTVIAQSGQSNNPDLLANRLADGLIRMREDTVRTIIVAACIPKSWELIATRAVNSTADRFTVLELSTEMPGAAVASAIIERHLGELFGEIGFTPPYPTWPVLPGAFDGAEVSAYTPRRLLQQVEGHVRRCLDSDVVAELERFGVVPESLSSVNQTVASVDLTAVDARFARLRADADVIGPLDPKQEDSQMSALLDAALHGFILERTEDRPKWQIDPASVINTALHARLRRTIVEATEDEEHWSFRAIAHPHPNAVLNRLKSATLEAGLQAGTSKRHLVVLRNTPFSPGRVTTTKLAEFEAANGLALPISDDDLRTFTALKAMFATPNSALIPWLVARRPASTSQLFSKIFDGIEDAHEETATSGAASTPVAPVADSTPEALGNDTEGARPVVDGRDDERAARATEGTAEPPSLPTDPAPDSEPSVFLGRYVETGREFRVPLLLLRKHTAVFAGSGSGKTVLLRRLVEEAALHGVSSILIDTNNDLARLGDRWPEPPAGWGRDDPTLAERYRRDTDVVVWTPRREAGRPLALNPLPDFSGVREDIDEFRTAIDASVAGLVARAGLTPRRLPTGKAVLTEAMRHFAERGGADLSAFIAMLSNLPEGVSTMNDAARSAASMAEELKAAMINDPIFGGAGHHLDPGMLLTPAVGKRARVSVISCIGLPTDEQRQTFVNQLQLALFAWIKRHPAGDRPLGGLLVLDEAQTFVPTRGTTASTESTLKLAAQARKYGLGLVYATQAPKALHNAVTGNSATQFFGLLNASVQIQAAKELARAKGGAVDDISRLRAGRFYGATEGMSFGKLVVPMCLSHHPASALTEDEVLLRARNGPR